MDSTDIRPEIVFFPAPADLRAWFERHHATETELHVGFYKKGSGKPSVTWPESVDEALCHGWIDGVRRSLDDERYTIRFTPRKPTSIWSVVNLRRVEILGAENRMQSGGWAAHGRRKAENSVVYAYEQGREVALPEWCVAKFQEHPAAWAWFQAQAAWYRRQAAWRIVSAKQEGTRRRRLDKLIADSSAEKRVR